MVNILASIVVAGIVQVGPNQCQVQILDLQQQLQEYTTLCEMVVEEELIPIK